MKKILILTGKLAFNSVQKLTKSISDEVEVLELPISIAAFITPEIILKALKKIDLSKYDYILCPGLIRGNLKNLESELEIKIYKGPRYAVDIPAAVQNPEKLSSAKPADIIFLEKELKYLDEITKRKIDEKSFLIGESESALYIGTDSYPVILAEIVNAPKLSLKKNLEKAKYYTLQGANIIDIGAIIGEDNSKKIKEIIESIKNDPILKATPVSIDSLKPAEIEAGVEAGADLVLSIDKGNMEEISNINKEIGVIVLPTNISEGFMPYSSKNRVKSLNENILIAKKLGFEKIIADPLLEAPINPGLFNSLESYNLFRKMDSETPLMFGIGNIIELIDTDGVGIDSIFACLAFELKVTAFLTTEYSTKTRGTVKELSQALKMAYLAKKRNMPPKDLPITNFKAKSKYDYMPYFPTENVNIIEIGKKIEDYEQDTKGFFRIWVNHNEGKIIVAHYHNEGLINVIISGFSAESLGKEIMARKLINLPIHILYLGRELEKAEICLTLGKSYIQDTEFGEN